jgi:hypothetical protein
MNWPWRSSLVWNMASKYTAGNPNCLQSETRKDQSCLARLCQFLGHNNGAFFFFPDFFCYLLLKKTEHVSQFHYSTCHKRSLKEKIPVAFLKLFPE